MDVPISDAREELAYLANRVNYSGERAVLTRAGEAIAALISVADLELLERLEDAADAAAAHTAKADPEYGLPRIPLDDLKAELGL